MDFYTACKILNIDTKTDYTFADIRKKYHLLALEFHPDKNTDSNAHEKFQEITEAYELLKPLYEHSADLNDRHSKSYIDIVYEFFGDLTTDKGLTSCYRKCKDYTPLINIFRNEYTLHTIQNLDYGLLLDLSNYIELYFKIFNIAEDLREKIKHIIENRMSSIKYHELRPSLKNLKENDIFPFVYEEGNTIYVPLWHKELIYDNIVICCHPILPEHISIDEDNNIIYKLELSLEHLWQKGELIVLPEFPNIKIQRESLYIREQQTLIFKKEGISRINNNNILDIREKSNVIVNILLY